MARSGFDPRISAVVESSLSLPASTQPPIPARIDRYNDSQVEMTTTTDSPGVVVLADAYYPGWQAELDGKPTPIFPVDIAFRGVKVPAGVHTVTMEYRPTPVLLGALGVPTGVVVFGLGGWGVPALQRARRRPRAVAA
jgi:hypothetical protein